LNQAWYQVVSLLYGYLAAAAIVVIALSAVYRLFSDAALLRRVKKHTPRIGTVGTLRVLSAGTRRLPAGHEISVPYEGTLGASHSCDVYIPYRKVHMRSAFFWAEKDGLHMVALHRDGLFADDVAVDPGDEAVLRDGAVLRVRDLKLLLTLYPGASARGQGVDIGPYVTPARKTRAQQGRGEGIGAPGKGEIRREKKLSRKREGSKTEKKPARKAAKAGQRPEKAAGKNAGRKKTTDARAAQRKR